MRISDWSSRRVLVRSPSIRFCRILTFQASAFDHSATAPHRWNAPPSGWRCDRQARRLPPAPAPGMVAAMIAPLLVLLAAAQAAAAPAPSDPIAADWKPIPDDELMVMTLGDGHRVVLRLASASAPDPSANPTHPARGRRWVREKGWH